LSLVPFEPTHLNSNQHIYPQCFWRLHTCQSTMTTRSALQKKLLAEDSEDEYVPAKDADDDHPPLIVQASSVSTQALLSEDDSTTTTTTTTSSKGGGLTLFIKQQLLTEINKQGGVTNNTQTTRIVSKACNKNIALFGDKEGKSPRNRRKQCKNFVNELKTRNPTPKELQEAINSMFSTVAIPTPFEASCIGITLDEPELQQSLNKPTPKAPKAPTEPSPKPIRPKPIMPPKREKKSRGNRVVVEIPPNASK